MRDDDGHEDWPNGDPLSSHDLAELMVDALANARVIKPGDIDLAVTILEEEIETRKTALDQ